MGLTITFFLAVLAHSALSPAMQAWLLRIARRSEMLEALLGGAGIEYPAAARAAIDS